MMIQAGECCFDLYFGSTSFLFCCRTRNKYQNYFYLFWSGKSFCFPQRQSSIRQVKKRVENINTVGKRCPAVFEIA